MTSTTLSWVLFAMTLPSFCGGSFLYMNLAAWLKSLLTTVVSIYVIDIVALQRWGGMLCFGSGTFVAEGELKPFGGRDPS